MIATDELGMLTCEVQLLLLVPYEGAQLSVDVVTKLIALQMPETSNEPAALLLQVALDLVQVYIFLIATLQN